MDAPSILELLDSYAAGTADPVGVVAEVYRRLEEYDDPALCIHLIDREHSLTQARKLQERGSDNLPLFGIPFFIKDNIDLAGVPTTAGCPGYSSVPEQSATVVQRLIDAGAIPIAKTNLDQFATGLVGTRSPYGIPRNALNPELIPGGSSSGSGVGVSAGIVPFSLGTDTAGSGRVPAAAGNIIGCKPSRGRLSCSGVVPAVKSLDCVSIFTRTCADAELVLHVASGYDANDPFSRKDSQAARLPIRSIGIPRSDQLDFWDSEAAASSYRCAVGETLPLVDNLIEVDIEPLLEAAQLLYGGPWVAERTAAVGESITQEVDGLDPTVSGIIAGGHSYSAIAAYEAQYRLNTLMQQVQPLWDEIDALILPTAPRIPTVAEAQGDPVAVNTRLGTYTNFVNLLDCCALALPAPKNDADQPYGITLVAPAWQDESLLHFAEKLHPLCSQYCGATHSSVPPVRTPQPSLPGWVELAVFGAHLRGQPLEYQLRERGARYLRTSSTTADYRLYKVPRSEPPKPGLVRVNDNGHAIACEVWAMPTQQLGSFLAAIPSPPRPCPPELE